MNGSRLRPYLLPLVAALIVLAVGVGSAIAAIPNGGSTYYACLVKNTGAVRLINYPRVKCARGERLIKWNQQGPEGPAGPVGPKGDPGPADWNAIPNKPAGFADGADDVGSVGYITAAVPCPIAIPPGGSSWVVFYDMPRWMVHDFQVVPTNNPPNSSYLYIDRVEAQNHADGTIDLWVLVQNSSPAWSGTCNIRRITWTEGISVAKAKQQLKKVEVGYPKKHPKE
jgi:hypothetical protein